MDDDEAIDRLKWEVITPDSLRAAYEPTGRVEPYAIGDFEQDQRGSPATPERVIVF